MIAPAGRLIGLIVALALLRGERLPERRRMLRRLGGHVRRVLTLEVIALLVFVVGL